MTATVAPQVLAAERVASGQRVATLDGVRALAVVAVMAVHALPASGFPGGVGVDVFFVLSGYLITALLLSERERRGTVDVPRFYARRFLRLAPALFLWLAALYPLGTALVGEAYVERALIVAQFRANLALTVQGLSVGPLEHAWSLGQEAQFYLVWPPVLLLLLALRAPRWLLAAALTAGALWSFRALYVVQEADLRPTDDFRLDGRAGGLLLGCALALALRSRWAVLRTPGLAEAGLLSLVALFAVGTVVGTPLQVAAPVAVVATVLLVGGLLGGPPGSAAALLSLPPLVFLGRISYSLYLWHYPFFRAFEDRPDLPLAVVLVLEVTLAVAAAAMSYTVVEQPVARWSARRLHR